MGRDASIASNNVWFKARKNAAKWDDRLSSRFGAATMLHVSEDVIADTETGIYKHMPVETAVRMADLYNAPELLNFYCMNECPIGCNKALSDEIVDIDRVTVRLLKHTKLEKLESIKEKMIDIAEDGEITEDELPDLIEINEYLKGLSKTLSEIETITERTIKARSK